MRRSRAVRASLGIFGAVLLALFALEMAQAQWPPSGYVGSGVGAAGGAGGAGATGPTGPTGPTGAAATCSGDINAGCSQVTAGSHLSAGTVPNAALVTTPVALLCKAVGNPSVDIVSSTTLTAVLSCAVPSNGLGANGVIRYTVVADLLNNTGGGLNVTVSEAFGGTNVVSGTIAPGSNANRNVVLIRGYLQNTGTTNSQYGNLVVEQFTPAVASGSLSTSGNDVAAQGYGTGSKDTTASQTLAINITLGTNSAQAEFRAFSAVVELMTP